MMKRLLLALALLLACSVTRAQQQNFPGSSSGSSSPGVFNFLNYGAIDDDTTDNCANGAVAAFTAAVNAYSGPGFPTAIIGAGFLNKAFKLATNSNACSFIFTIPVTLHISGNIDCAQTANNCMQVCPTGLGALVNANLFQYTIDGGGTFTGGANLVNAGIEVEPFCGNSLITGLKFKNFGAGNGTLGNCTNYGILVDQGVAETTISYNQWQMNDSTSGRCAFANPNGSIGGTNTVFFVGNVIGCQNLAGTTSSSVGITEGGSVGVVDHNNIFGCAADIRLQGIGTRVVTNTLDSGGISNNGVNAAIQWGGRSATTAVSNIVVSANVISLQAAHTTTVFAKAGDTNGGSTITGITLTGNIPFLNTGGNLTDGTNCGPNSTTGTACYEFGNEGISSTVTCGSTSTGWQYGSLLAGCASSSQTANIGSATLFTPNIVNTLTITGQVLMTTAAGTSSTLPTVSITYTDFFTNSTQTVQITPTWASGTVGCSGAATNTLGNSCQGTLGPITPKAGTAVTYSTANYASSGTAMQYQAFVRANIQ